MSRGISAAFEAAARAGTARPFCLIEGLFDSGPLRIWTGVGDISWDGKAWAGRGKTMRVSVPAETAEVRANGAQIELNGLDPALLALIDAEPYQGRRITVWLGFFDLSTGAIISDPDIIGAGIVDVVDTVDEAETATLVASIEALDIDNERARERLLTDEEQKRDYPDDRAFEYVNGLQDKTVIWEDGIAWMRRIGEIQ